MCKTMIDVMGGVREMKVITWDKGNKILVPSITRLKKIVGLRRLFFIKQCS